MATRTRKSQLQHSRLQAAESASDKEDMAGARLGRLWIGLCAATVIVGLGSGTASARVATQARFTLHASHGYTADFSANGPGAVILYGKAGQPKPPGDDGLTVQVSKGHASAAYFHPAHFMPKRISGRVGGLGRVKVHFHRQRTRKVSLSHCSGYIVRRIGVFTGTIRFRGERGYTKLRARRAHGTVEVPRDLHCHFGRGGGGGGGRVVHWTYLDASNDPSNLSGYTDLFAEKSRASDTSYFFVDRTDAHGQMLIGRSAWARAPRSAFTFEPDLSSAHVEPPAPFSGSADFSAPHQWTGSLSVSLPGAGDVPLTGPDFSASLRHHQ
jgi:hypothetical protein